ncbi:MAG: SNF2-related protein [Spirochaetota bacterium]
MRFDPKTLSRGAGYFREGHVQDVQINGSRAFGVVSGTRPKPYTVMLELSDPSASVCSCPVRVACKHLVALMLELWNDPEIDSTTYALVDHAARASGMARLLDESEDAWRGQEPDLRDQRDPRHMLPRSAGATEDDSSGPSRFDLEAEIRRMRESAGAARPPGARASALSRTADRGDGPLFVEREEEAGWRAALLIGSEPSRRPMVAPARQYRKKDGAYGRVEALRGHDRVYVERASDRALVERLAVLGGAAPLVALTGELLKTRLPIFAGRPGDSSGAQDRPVRVVRTSSYLVDVVPRQMDEVLRLSCELHARTRPKARALPPMSDGRFDAGMGVSVASFERSGLVLVDSADSPLAALGRWLERWAPVTPRSVADLLELTELHPTALEVRYPPRIRVSEVMPAPVFVLSHDRGELHAWMSLEADAPPDGYDGDEYVVHVVREGDPSAAIAAATKAIGVKPHAPFPWTHDEAWSDSGPWRWTRAVKGRRPDLLEVARTLAEADFVVYVGGRGGRRRVRRAQPLAVTVASGTNWFAPVVTAEEGPALDPLLLRELALRGAIDQGAELLLFSPEEIERVRRLLEITGDAPRSRLPKTDLASLADLTELADTLAPDLEPVRTLATSIAGGRTPRAPRKPRGLTAKLRPYQREGFGWLASLARHGLSGCLADDMGLGKTVQALAFMLHLRDQDEAGQANLGTPADEDAPVAGGFLVIAPVTTLGNWQREAERFAPVLTVARHHGTDRTGDAATLASSDLIVTSYATAARDRELLGQIRWRLIVLDEAQAIKNPHARTTRRVKSLQSTLRLCLTGTPVENVSTDLWSIMDFLVPGLLGTLPNFTSRFPKRNVNGSEQAASRLARLRRIVAPFLLRRTKEAVAPELPPRIESVVTCAMGSRQRRFYETLRSHHHNQVRLAIRSGDIRKIGAAVFTGLLRLRQAAIYPAAADDRGRGVPSAKEEELLERLEEVIGEGHRALVFSQFVAALARFRDAVAARGIETLYLDGSTMHRDELIDRFQRAGGPLAFFISLKAGGTGINLTAADHVFICDPWWNPQVERQAVDRAHRIGRDRPVIVSRLVTEGTIEQKVLELQEQKRSLAADLISENSTGVDLSSADELLALFE